MDYGNIAGLVKSFVEPEDAAGNPKRYVLWAKERIDGGDAVDILYYDFIAEVWAAILPSKTIFKVKTASIANVSNLGVVSNVGGIVLQDNDYVLLKDQANSIENGVYIFNTGALSRPPDYIGTITRDHVVYVTHGTNANKIYASVVSGLTQIVIVDTDAIQFVSFSVGGSSSSISTTLIRLETVDDSATINNFATRLIDVINNLATFELTNTQEVLIKHIYQTPALVVDGDRVNRVCYFKFNKQPDTVAYGNGGYQITSANLTQITPNHAVDKIFHPDEIGLDGMGGYDFGDVALNIAEGSGKTQHDFNKAILKAATGAPPFGNLTYKKANGNINAELQAGDAVYSSWLNDGIFLKFGLYVAGDPLEIGSYDAAGADYYDPV